VKTRGLVVKIYLFSIFSLMVTAAVLLAFTAMSTTERRRDVMLISEHIVVDMAQRRADPANLRGDVDRLRPAQKIKVSLYDPSGRLIASTAEPPLALPPLERLKELDTAPAIETDPWVFVHAVREGDRVVAYGVARNEVPPSLGLLLARSVGLLLAFLAAIAVLFARHLARPLQKVVDAAERFGRGDLSIRTRTDRRDEIGAVGRAFDEMADRVSRLVGSQQELMANVSHELQTPLSRIRVAVDLMSEGDASRAEEMLTEITQDLEELDALIDDVMTLARLDLFRAGSPALRHRLQRERVSLGELLTRSCDRFRSLHSSHVVARDIPTLPAIEADPVLLRRAFDNVLDNARKYSPGRMTIRLTARPGPDSTAITIEDYGIGIAAGDLDKIFTPFFRADRSRSRATGGVGLGLALTRRVVEAHGGRIEVASVVGQGTAVTIVLPTPAVERAPERAGTAPVARVVSP
jgi:two-component system, OmpR family, sensor kinase